MKCPKCKRDTYTAKWGTCTVCGAINSPKAAINKRSAINEERLTDAINTPRQKPDHKPRRDSGVLPVLPPQSVGLEHQDAPSHGARVGFIGSGREPSASVRTPNRRSREAYNAYELHGGVQGEAEKLNVGGG